jgi:hypothetical protein
MRFAHAVILLMVLLSMLAVAGCTGSGGSPKGPGETPGGQSSATLPTTPGDLTNMKFLWNNVHYLHQTSYTTSTIPAMNGLETMMTWKLSDNSYKGQPAKLLNISIDSSADQTKVNNTFSFNMGFDIYYSKAGDILTMLGGYAYLELGDDPADIMKGELNVSQMVEQSRVSGYTDPVTGEYITVQGPARFSPTIDLSRPVMPVTDPNDVENSAQSGYDMNKLMSAGSVEYNGFGNITLTPAGRETLKIGNRNVDCYKYTWTVQMKKDAEVSWETANYTAWYSPDFPAQPLKTVVDNNNGETVQTTVVDEWN